MPKSKLKFPFSLRLSLLLVLLSLIAIVSFYPLASSIPILNDLIDEVDERVFIFPLLFLALVLLFYQTRKTNKRLTELRNIAAIIGKGNYSIRSEDIGDDHIGQLARSVNWMAVRIEKSMNELEQNHAELEQSKLKLENQNNELSLAIKRQQQFGSFLGRIHAIDINKLANTAIDALLEISHCELGCFFFWEGQKRQLVPIAGKSVDGDALNKLRLELKQTGLLKEVMKRKEWIALENMDSEIVPTLDLGVMQVKLGNVYGIPIHYREQVLGVIVLGSTRSLDENTRTFVNQSIDAVANSFSNALTYRSVQKQSVHLEEVNTELMRAQKAKSQFLANMSHELRTPLNSIIGFSSILSKNKKENLNESDLNRVEKINRNGRHLLALINDILDISKVESGKMEFEFTEVDLNFLVEDVIEMLLPQAEAKNIKLSQDSDAENSVKVLSDESKLKQVIINLVGNAIKFTKQGGVTVHLKDSGEAVFIEIEDTGIGIKEEHIEKIFQPFSQADSSTTREFGGTGLGLSISKTFVETMGGSLNVDSEFGKGSVFRITLRPNDIKEALDTQNEGNADGKKPRVVKTVPVRTKPQGKESLQDAQASDVENGEADKTDESEEEAIMREVQKTLKKKGKKKSGDSKEEETESKESEDEEESETKTSKVSRKIEDKDSPGKNMFKVGDREGSFTKAPFLKSKSRDLKSNQGTINEVLRRVMPPLPGKKVLVVDDSDEARQILKEYIDEMGATCKECGNPTRLMEMVDEFEPDLITLDIMMPGKNGWEVLKELKDRAKTSRIPVIIVSMVAEQNRAISLGAVDALNKPIMRDEFITTLQRNLNREKIEGRKVLIVDDFVEFHDILRAWVGEDKNEVRTAGDGKEALEILKDFTPEIVFLDLLMPVMDGFTFLDHFRKNEAWAQIPVVVVTGKSLDSDEAEFLRKRASAVLTKDFSDLPDDLEI